MGDPDMGDTDMKGIAARRLAFRGEVETGVDDLRPCGGPSPGGRPMASAPTAKGRIATALAMLVLGSAAPPPARAEGASNVVPLVMRTPRGGFDRLVVSVTLCEPGTERCATVDDVMVDTGSTGLRLEASAVPDWLRLPPFLGSGGHPLAECLRFVHDTAWGALHRADVRLGGLTARALPLQVIDDGGGPQPAACPRSDASPTSNGTLGLGQHPLDCQGACEQKPEAPGVFVADGSGWMPLRGRVDPAYRLPNPVSFLPVHDDGIVIEMPAPPGGAAREVAGTLTFGVGTADDNRLGASTRLDLDAAGRFTTVFRGESYPESYIDSGTETYIFRDDGLPRCRDRAWAYCVEPRRALAAELVGRNGTRVPVDFTVGDDRARRERRAGASDDVAEAAEPGSAAFVWGAPFFLGRRVSLVMDGRGVPDSPGLVGPFYAVR